jgi:hypothetical protein
MAVGTILAVAIAVTSPMLGLERRPSARLTYPSHQVSLKFQPPRPIKRNPISTGAGGRRGQRRVCIARNQALLSGIQPKDFVEITANPRPSIYIFIPANSAQLADFKIFDNAGKLINQQQYKAPSKSGIYRVAVTGKKSLAVGERYNWRFALVCKGDDQSQDESIAGEIERIELSVEQNQRIAHQMKFLDKAQLYADYGLWNETLDLLINQEQRKSSEFQDLLRSAGIQDEQILQAPFQEIQELK